MPFRALASLKKIANLDAEIVALAPDEKARKVAVISSDPVQVGVYSMAGGSAKLKKVGLDVASDGALIDQKIALVKSGSDLWALLDIQHTPKIEQVGREVRSLHNNPQAAMAFAVGWDGQGSDLRNTGRDAEAREFMLRGDVQACSIAGAHCYVVVGVSGGARFRAHDGGTPESGTNIRCDLPAAAAGFDRLAGGERLSALTKRGGDRVCLILREGAGALSAKMIGVQATIADVAVIDSSLFIAGTDGIVRLYGGDVLHRTNDGGQPPPTFELRLAANGEPTVMTSTTIGGNRLWIGTKGGDLLRCDAVKGDIKIQ